MIACFCALLDLSLIIYCLREKKSIFHPACILNAMWMAVHVLNMFLGWNSGEPAYFILALPALFFTIGFLLVEKDYLGRVKLFQKVAQAWKGFCVKCKAVFEKCTAALVKNRFVSKLPLDLSMSSGRSDMPICGIYPLASNLALAFVTVVFLVQAYAFLSKLSLYDNGNLWYTLRLIIWQHNVTGHFILKYTSTIALVLPSVLLVGAQKSKTKADIVKFAVSLIIAILWSFLLTSRTATFQVVILLVMSQILLMEQKSGGLMTEKERKAVMKKKLAMFAAAIVFILAMFIYVALKKDTNTYGDVSFIEFFVKSIANYTNLSSAAFVEWYKGGFEYAFGANTFRIIIAILNRLGILAVVPVANEGGIFIPYGGLSTNALTVARAYVEDFGVVYMALVMMVFGMIHGAVYKRACRYTELKQIRYALINAMLDIPLFFQILTNQYLNVLSMWIQVVFWCWLFTGAVFWIKEEGSTPQQADQ